MSDGMSYRIRYKFAFVSNDFAQVNFEECSLNLALVFALALILE